MCSNHVSNIKIALGTYYSGSSATTTGRTVVVLLEFVLHNHLSSSTSQKCEDYEMVKFQAILFAKCKIKNCFKALIKKDAGGLRRRCSVKRAPLVDNVRRFSISELDSRSSCT